MCVWLLQNKTSLWMEIPMPHFCGKAILKCMPLHGSQCLQTWYRERICAATPRLWHLWAEMGSLLQIMNAALSLHLSFGKWPLRESVWSTTASRLREQKTGKRKYNKEELVDDEKKRQEKGHRKARHIWKCMWGRKDRKKWEKKASERCWE